MYNAGLMIILVSLWVEIQGMWRYWIMVFKNVWEFGEKEWIIVDCGIDRIKSLFIILSGVKTRHVIY